MQLFHSSYGCTYIYLEMTVVWKKKNPERFAHISEEASGSCTNLKILFEFTRGISHSPAQNLTLTMLKTTLRAKPAFSASTERPPSTSHPILLQRYLNSICFPKWHQKTTSIWQSSAKPCSSCARIKVQRAGRGPGAHLLQVLTPEVEPAEVTPSHPRAGSCTGLSIAAQQPQQGGISSISPKIWVCITCRERISPTRNAANGR